MKRDYVTIENCVAKPDLVVVPNHTNIHWVVDKSDTATYTVIFLTDNLIHDPPPVVSYAAPDKMHTVSNGCTTATPSACDKFPYILYRKTGETYGPCADPGLHVTPQ